MHAKDKGKDPGLHGLCAHMRTQPGQRAGYLSKCTEGRSSLAWASSRGITAERAVNASACESDCAAASPCAQRIVCASSCTVPASTAPAVALLNRYRSSPSEDTL